MKKRDILEKLIAAQLVKKSPAFYGISLSVYYRVHKKLLKHEALCNIS
jgi:hypothetical protein